MNSNMASCFSRSSLCLSVSAFSSSPSAVLGGDAVVAFEEKVPLGLGAAVDVCDS